MSISLRVRDEFQYLKIRALQTVYNASLYPSVQEFYKAARDPSPHFTNRLLSYVRENEATRFGQEHGFSKIQTTEDYCQAVPVRDYDGLSPYIIAAFDGEKNVLTKEDILVFEKTGGSTQANKFIPYTKTLRREFERAMQPWFADLMRTYPRLFGTRMYWSISPATQKVEKSPGGIRVGGSDDTDYFSAIGKWAFQEMLAAPMGLGKLSDMERWKWESALHLLQAKDLGLISVWSPTFATNLFAYMENNWEKLLAKMDKRRRRDLSAVMQNEHRFAAEKVWPRLQVLSCWADGISEQFLPELKKYLGPVPIQAKGLLATEGVITTPYGESHEGHVINPLGHFLEFREVDGAKVSETTILAHELELGRSYTPILTTGGGFYRYHLKDLVTCTGYFHQLPRLRFEGKLDKVSDLVGEKISAAQVERLIADGKKRLSLDTKFAMLAPASNRERGYALFIESSASDEDLSSFSDFVESGLRLGHHYDYARSLGQLGKVQVQRIKNGTKIFEDALVHRGQRRGEIKATCLDTRDNWQEIFARQQF